MPIYAYDKCLNCGAPECERLLASYRDAYLQYCQCGTVLTKLPTAAAAQFKDGTSGWAKDNYASKPKNT